MKQWSLNLNQSALLRKSIPFVIGKNELFAFKILFEYSSIDEMDQINSILENKLSAELMLIWKTLRKTIEPSEETGTNTSPYYI